MVQIPGPATRKYAKGPKGLRHFGKRIRKLKEERSINLPVVNLGVVVTADKHDISPTTELIQGRPGKRRQNPHVFNDSKVRMPDVQSKRPRDRLREILICLGDTFERLIAHLLPTGDPFDIGSPRQDESTIGFRI